MFRHSNLEQCPEGKWITGNCSEMLFFGGNQPKLFGMYQHDARTVIVFVLRTMTLALSPIGDISDVLDPDVLLDI